ncbi:putative E3 ubiquitin-protein ligase RING1b isoform X1 [Dioscorea cayenensis subsp. rotundata]|uniref:RING-type E3 ubiquitin transferase n=1 Tax=Dioscorea cayennensis subsp. rotundata TaxID=55577 RepID=A0AB40CFB6_DIOCR|nr:putative E3 ubiquitin-protein ligase RING1b isoform X1 [Dioscorea cayenensis subsp. rotundata]
MRSEEEKKDESMLSPGFRSAAAMAGWDEEALLLASLIVEDTPLRESRQKKRPGFLSKTPSSTNSIRKRRPRRQSPGSLPAVVLCLDDEKNDVQEGDGVKRREEGDGGVDEEKNGGEEVSAEKVSENGFPCIDRLREELSCAICLEVCFEPSTTPCGHSFCIKCLKSSASKCGKRCPKCRQLISSTRSYTVNTVLWNTIQLLFPDEIKARTKCINTSSSPKTSPERRNRNTITSSARTTISQAPRAIARDNNNGSNRRRRAMPSQSEDAALALRLQREEFMEAFRENDNEQQQQQQHQPRNASVYTARNNLRAMASRAVNFRRRGRFPYIID